LVAPFSCTTGSTGTSVGHKPTKVSPKPTKKTFADAPHVGLLIHEKRHGEVDADLTTCLWPIIFLVVGDVPVNSETLLVTDFMNIRIKLVQSFKCAHRGMECMRVFIGRVIVCV
jgi:hypothetical protein